MGAAPLLRPLLQLPYPRACVNTRSAHDLGILKPELFSNQLGVSEVSFKLESFVGATHDSVEHLALC